MNIMITITQTKIFAFIHVSIYINFPTFNSQLCIINHKPYHRNHFLVFSFMKTEVQEQTNMHACARTDHDGILFCIFIFCVILQRDMRGAQDGRRALPIAVAVLWEPYVAQ